VEDSSLESLSVGLVIGGSSKDYDTSTPKGSVDAIGGTCAIPDLPAPRTGHVSFMTADPEAPRLMVCGGLASDGRTYDDIRLPYALTLDTCLQYEPTTDPPVWTNHSRLRTDRVSAAAVTLAAGTYILGGHSINRESGEAELQSTSEFLPRGQGEWQEGPGLPETLAQLLGLGLGLSRSCAVTISATSFLLIGGETAIGRSRVVNEFNALTGRWSEWPPLAAPRAGHACSLFQGGVIVAGGGNGHDVEDGAETTEIVHVASRKVRSAGSMLTRRAGFGMFEVGFKDFKTLITFGSWDVGLMANSNESQTEEWLVGRPVDHASGLGGPPRFGLARYGSEGWHGGLAGTEEWPGTRHGFSAVTVEARHVCPKPSKSI
jgi:hypothetical protein